MPEGPDDLVDVVVPEDGWWWLTEQAQKPGATSAGAPDPVCAEILSRARRPDDACSDLLDALVRNPRTSWRLSYADRSADLAWSASDTLTRVACVVPHEDGVHLFTLPVTETPAVVAELVALRPGVRLGSERTSTPVEDLREVGRRWTLQRLPRGQAPVEAEIEVADTDDGWWALVDGQASPVDAADVWRAINALVFDVGPGLRAPWTRPAR